jgi:hypothetical protein
MTSCGGKKKEVITFVKPVLARNSVYIHLGKIVHQFDGWETVLAERIKKLKSIGTKFVRIEVGGWSEEELKDPHSKVLAIIISQGMPVRVTIETPTDDFHKTYTDTYLVNENGKTSIEVFPPRSDTPAADFPSYRHPELKNYLKSYYENIFEKLLNKYDIFVWSYMFTAGQEGGPGYPYGHFWCYDKSAKSDFKANFKKLMGFHS